jgi:hypothetical protein
MNTSRNFLKLLASCAIVALVGATPANAATITATQPDAFGRTFVDIKGPIFPDDDKKLDSLLGEKPDASRVIIRLSSPGGAFIAGMNMATSIHDKHLATLVPNGAMCGSMCAIMWVAGSTKAVGGFESAIGFHNIYSGVTGLAVASDNAILGSFLGKLGLGYKAIKWMTEKPAGGGNFLNAAKAREFGIAVVSPEDLPVPVSAPVSVSAPQTNEWTSLTRAEKVQKCLSQGLQFHEEGSKSFCRRFEYGPSTNVSSSPSSEEKEPYVEE